LSASAPAVHACLDDKGMLERHLPVAWVRVEDTHSRQARLV
jgi:hypothetical protein